MICGSISMMLRIWVVVGVRVGVEAELERNSSQER